MTYERRVVCHSLAEAAFGALFFIFLGCSDVVFLFFSCYKVA